jgi:hypothetical protein
MKEPVERVWVSAQYAAYYSGLSRTTLWRRAAKGDLKVAHVGRRVLFNLPSLTAFMERATEETGRSNDDRVKD